MQGTKIISIVNKIIRYYFNVFEPFLAEKKKISATKGSYTLK